MDELNNIGRSLNLNGSRGRAFRIIGREGSWYRLLNQATGHILRLQVNTVLRNGSSLY
jgi:hypothetical protein